MKIASLYNKRNPTNVNAQKLKKAHVLFAFMWRPMPHAACTRLCSRDSTWAGVFVRSARSSASSVSVNKIFMCFKQKGPISTLSSKPLKFLYDKMISLDLAVTKWMTRRGLR